MKKQMREIEMSKGDYLGNSSDKSIVFFDGVCNLCNASVQFILKNEQMPTYDFATLQSAYASRLMTQQGIDPTRLNSILLFENGRIYDKSTAVLRICKNLKRPWRYFYYLKIIPRFLLDLVYDGVAKMRYRIFGKKDICMTPTTEIQKRFLI